jgi:hypothetical protein
MPAAGHAAQSAELSTEVTDVLTWSGHELSRPKRVSWLPASGRMWATSIPVSCGGVETHVFMNDFSGGLMGFRW